MSNTALKGEHAADEADLKRLLADPATYFGHSYARAHSTPRAEREVMQLAGLKMRFNDLRNRIPILQKLADEQGVHEIKELNDVVPLLFSHTVYKSYPLSLLEKNRFKQLTQWLNKLTTIDLSDLDVSHCQGIDDWIDTLDANTPIRLRHSSATSGIMSFIPRTEHEADKHFFSMIIGIFDRFGMEPPRPDKPLSMHLVSPTYRAGNTAILRTYDYFAKYIAGGDESKVHTLYPGKQSSDLMFLAARVRSAQAKGELDRLQLSPSLLARREEFEQLQRNQVTDMKNFYDDVVKNLAGEKIYTMGPWNVLYNVAEAGLAAGLEKVFHPEAVIMTGGGAKGQVVPPDWEDKVKRFFNVKHLAHCYAMTEVMGANRLCEYDRFHMETCPILFILDPETGAPLPRSGVQTGRAAFFDLLAETYWGGFVTGDEVSVDWDTPCKCGRLSPHLARKIERFSEQHGGDDKISCAAAADAHDAALDFLTDSLS